MEESEENCVETVMPLQGSAAKVKKVLSDLQKESLKRARDSATIYRKQLRDEKQRLGIVDKKGLSKLQMRLRDLQRVDDPPPTVPEDSVPEEVPEELVVEVHGFFRDEWGNLFMK